MARWTKVLFSHLIHLIHNTYGVEVVGDSHCPDSHHESVCYAVEKTKRYHAWKGIIYWNFQWDVSLGWVNYLTPLGEGEVLSLWWALIVRLQAGPVETRCTWNGTCTIEG